jgi:hypothetical protein
VDWTTQGTRILEVLERDSPWFRGWDARTAPRDVLSDLRVDSAGRLWVTGLVWVIEDWEPPGLHDLARIDGIRDETVEVIDPDRREVIARRRFDDPWIREVHGSDLLMSFRQTEDGYIFIDLLRLRLE